MAKVIEEKLVSSGYGLMATPELLANLASLYTELERSASAYRSFSLALATHEQKKLPDGERAKGLPILEFKVPAFDGTKVLTCACDLMLIREFEPSYIQHILVPLVNYHRACLGEVLADIRALLAALEKRIMLEETPIEAPQAG